MCMISCTAFPGASYADHCLECFFYEPSLHKMFLLVLHRFKLIWQLQTSIESANEQSLFPLKDAKKLYLLLLCWSLQTHNVESIFPVLLKAGSGRADCSGSCCILDISKGGYSVSSLSHLVLCFTILTIKMLFLLFKWHFCSSVCAHCLLSSHWVLLRRSWLELIFFAPNT